MAISQICENLNISQDTLRYYERIGLIPKIEKNSGGFREYTEVDCQRISMIKSLRTAGMPIDALAKYIAMARSDDGMVIPEKKC
jgi:Predicted transcriptional regulators